MLFLKHLLLMKKFKQTKSPTIVETNKFENYVLFTSESNINFIYDEYNQSTMNVTDNMLVHKFFYHDFDYLLENNYIEVENNVIIVKFNAYHYIKIAFKNFCTFCFKSVFVPIVVSVITTFLYLYLK